VLALIAALALGGAGCTSQRSHHPSYYESMRSEGSSSHGSHSQGSGRPEVDLLLGIHRLGGVLLGDAALRAELDQIRMRVDDPMILAPLSPKRRGLFPGSRGAQKRMHEILERGFAGRLVVIPEDMLGRSEPATHALESTFSELEEGVEIRFRLVSLSGGNITGSARGMAPGADLSIVTSAPEDGADAGENLGRPLEEVDHEPPPPLSQTEPVESAPEPLAHSTAPHHPPALEPAEAPPSPSDIAGQAPGENVPEWIYELLSQYSEPTEKADG
jgi:hypothetical protein